LHDAVDAGVGAAGDERPVLAMRTVEMERPAHVFEYNFNRHLAIADYAPSPSPGLTLRRMPKNVLSIRVM
jgi:hypothetical protein